MKVIVATLKQKKELEGTYKNGSVLEFILDANGKYWYFENLQLTATGEGSGTARNEGSKYSVTLLAEADHLAYDREAADVISPAFPSI
jgi:hypothetical protein